MSDRGSAVRVYTVNELCTTRDCLTPGCPCTATPGTQRCETHVGRTDTAADQPVLPVRDGRYSHTKKPA